MLLIELPTLTVSTRMKKLGVAIDEEDFIEVSTFVNIDKITHIQQNPDNKKLTNIYLMGGDVLLTGIKAKSLIDQLTFAMRLPEEEEDDDISDINDLPNLMMG